MYSHRSSKKKKKNSQSSIAACKFLTISFYLYIKRESVDLALKLLDEDEIRGYKLHVEVAKFQLKGEYDASKKKRKCKDYKKKLSLQQKFVLFFPCLKDFA